MDFLIPQPLAQAILDYLANHPYREVAPFVQALQQLKPAPASTVDEEAAPVP